MIRLVDKVLKVTATVHTPITRGAPSGVKLTEDEKSLIIPFTTDTTAKSYERLAIGHSIFSTNSYAKKGFLQNNCYFFSNQLNGYGRIERILQFEGIQECIIFYRPIVSCEISIDNVACCHGEFQGRVLAEMKVISSHDITKQCLVLYNNKQEFYIFFKPNTIEGS